MTKDFFVRDDQLFIIAENADEDIFERVKIITVLQKYLDNWNLCTAPQLAEKARALLDEPELSQGISNRMPLKSRDVQTAIEQEISNAKEVVETQEQKAA